jgi:hypothetical protein
MAIHKILVTGDFWHTDFQKIVSKFDVPVTLVPFDKVETVVEQSYDLVVLAQSRRDQFLDSEVEELITNFPAAPVVGLLGSWCEGESRSGKPYPGVIQVYWHQWEGSPELLAGTPRGRQLCQITSSRGESRKIFLWALPI